jgi:hypothetical protein
MRHIIPISGKDSLATAIWQTAHEPDLPYEYVYNDTRAELPETYTWLDKVEATLGIKIERIGKSLEDIIDGYRILPSVRVRFCTKDAKIRPMDKFIGKEGAIVYFGLRSDEPERIGALKTKRLEPRYPLREACIGLATVYRIVGSRNLMPPAFFWERLYNDALAIVGASGRQIVEAWPQWFRDRTFAWRSRPNCFFCFFQRRYEWVGLLEHHPALFDKSEEIELRTGDGEASTRTGSFTWVQDYPLSKIRVKAGEIYQKRLNAVVKLIRSHEQPDFFRNALDELEMAGTSCGLLCGK